MDVIIQSKGFTAGEELESYITDKLQKLSRMDETIMRARVIVEEGQEATDNKHCSIRLEVPGNDHFAQKRGATYEAAALETIDTLQGIIRSMKK